MKAEGLSASQKEKHKARMAAATTKQTETDRERERLRGQMRRESQKAESQEIPAEAFSPAQPLPTQAAAAEELLFKSSGMQKPPLERCIRTSTDFDSEKWQETIRQATIGACAACGIVVYQEKPNTLHAYAVDVKEAFGATISIVRIYGRLIKISADAGANDPQSLAGHMICFPQSTSRIANAMLPHSDIDETIRVHFIGGSAALERMMPLLRAEGGPLQIRPAAVFAWLRRLKSTHPLYADIVIDDSEKSVAKMNAATERIIKGAVLSTDVASARLETASKSDIAAVSDHVGFGECVVENQDPRLELESRLNQIRGLLQVIATTAPLNEFDQNELIISGAFPWIFMFGRVGGEINAAFRRTIVLQHDVRVAKESALIFFLFNQMQRHRVTQNVAKASQADLDAINELARRADF